MRKQQHNVTLTGRILGGGAAKTHQAKEVIHFTGDSVCSPFTTDYFKVEEFPDYVRLSTKKGQSYVIKFDTMLNLFKGEVYGTKIHITLKKITGKLIYWA